MTGLPAQPRRIETFHDRPFRFETVDGSKAPEPARPPEPVKATTVAVDRGPRLYDGVETVA